MKLLRVLETGRFERLGSNRERQVKVRVVSATNADLPAMIREGTFREDLYYRLNGLEVALPALRERSDKVQLLDFLLAQEAEGQVIEIEPKARQALLDFAWPGNVRQLRNVLRTLVALCEEGRIEYPDLPQMVRNVGAGPANAIAGQVASAHRRSCDGRVCLGDAERHALLSALEANHWHMTRVAEHLGISRNTLYRKLRKHGIAKVC